MRIEKQFARPPVLHFGETHRDDRRFLDHRHPGSANDFGNARSLIRLNVEEENVRLIVRSNRSELRKQNLPRQVEIQKKKRSQA